MPNTPAHLMANGDIRCSRFCKGDITADFKCLEADANEEVMGISQDGPNYPPLSDVAATVLAAKQGQYMRMFGEGDICLLEAGDAVVRFDQLKSDADGKGVPITAGTTLQYVGAQALQSAAAAGELILVQCTPNRSVRTAIV